MEMSQPGASSPACPDRSPANNSAVIKKTNEKTTCLLVFCQAGAQLLLPGCPGNVGGRVIKAELARLLVASDCKASAATKLIPAIGNAVQGTAPLPSPLSPWVTEQTRSRLELFQSKVLQRVGGRPPTRRPGRSLDSPSILAALLPPL